jgi:cytochrome c556
MKIVITALTALAIAGCASQQASSPSSAVDIAKTSAYTCASAATALQALAPYKAKLTAAQIETIRSSIKVINPVCSSDSAPQTGTELASDALTGAVSAIESVLTTQQGAAK